MKTIIPPIYERIKDKSDPFKCDSFNRKEFADNLTKLIQNTDHGLVLTINSKWGDGKTSFIKLWQMELENNERIIPIYYDAFANDFTSDVFMSIAVLIYKTLKEKYKKDGIASENKEQIKYLKKTSIKLGKELLKMGVNAAVAAFTGGLVENKKLSEWVVNSFKRLFWGTIELNVEKKFEAHNNSHSIIKEYQEKLSSLLEIENTNQPDNKRKIVFFVDELDRCRPNFAVEVIEKIKHLFNVKNVFFILAINKSQLLSTIASVYGVTNEESSIYLQKFVHLETKLPPMLRSNNNGNVSNLEIYISDLIKELDIEKSILPEPIIVKTLNDFSQENYMSLNPRSIERIMTYIAIAFNSIEVKLGEELKKQLVVMSALRVGEPALYEKFKTGQISRDSKDNSQRYFEWMKNFFKGERIDTASQVMNINGIADACNILDVYEIPEIETKLKENKEVEKKPLPK